MTLRSEDRSRQLPPLLCLTALPSCAGKHEKVAKELMAERDIKKEALDTAITRLAEAEANAEVFLCRYADRGAARLSASLSALSLHLPCPQWPLPRL